MSAPVGNTELIESFWGLQARERYVLTHRLGLCGEKPKTHRAIGENVGCTRERVRQIYIVGLHHAWIFSGKHPAPRDEIATELRTLLRETGEKNIQSTELHLDESRAVIDG